MPTVAYRSFNPRLLPRRLRMEIPGWAGDPQPRADGAHEHPWHCVPFSEAARSAIELCYPFDGQLRVSTVGGELRFEATGDNPPFRAFGRHYYTYQILLDLKVPDGLAYKTETHPRFYTDRTGTVPIAVPAIIRAWWPMMFFVVFKAPLEGATHVFRAGEPFMVVTVVDPDDRVELVDMSPEQAAERELQSERIHASRETLGAGSRWTSDTDTVFDGTYRRLYAAARTIGED